MNNFMNPTILQNLNLLKKNHLSSRQNFNYFKRACELRRCEVQLNLKAMRHGVWFRQPGLSCVVRDEDETIGIEVVTKSITLRALTRFDEHNDLDAKILIIQGAGIFIPAKVKDVSSHSLKKVDLYVAIGSKKPIIKTQQDIVRAWPDFKIPDQLIVDLVQRFWSAQTPLSLHLSVGRDRHLPTQMNLGYQIDERRSRDAVRDLIGRKVLTLAVHPISGYKGLCVA
tara:strand:+ start:1288 stop:1965 length:678 start_codon:yes stop_codon:yes gene_type:complete